MLQEEPKFLADARLKNWISVNLPENCPNVCISFEQEIAEMQIKQFGASPLYDFDKEENWLPIRIFITYGGTLAPGQRRLGAEKGKCKVDEEKRAWLKSIGAGEFSEPVKYIYTFPEYKGAFNLSERYLEETSLEELKAQYQKNKIYAEEVVRLGKSQDNFFRGAEPL